MRKAILCGYNWIGCKALKLLLENNFEVFVYTHENPPYINSLVDLCKNLKVPFTTDKIMVKNLPFKPDFISSIYYRHIIKQEVISFVDGKIFNLHPSLLPKYRGCSSLTWAMINGEEETGFSYHYIDGGIDTGNIILQKRLEIEDFDTQVTLYHRVMFESAKYFNEVIEKVLNGSPGTKQETLTENYYGRGCPHNGTIDKSWDLVKIERFIRAMNYPPLPYAKFNEAEIKTISDFLAFQDYI